MPKVRRGAAALALAGAALIGVTGCTSSAVQPQTLKLGTGAEGAAFREIGAALAEVADEHSELGIELVHTEASVANAELLRAGEVDLGFVNADLAMTLLGDVEGLVRVFDSVFHIVVLDASVVVSVDDLDGLRVASGHALSGTRYTSEIVFAALGIDVTFVDASQSEAAAALADGSVDAMLSLTAYPTPAVGDLAAATPIRLIDLEEVAPMLVAEHPEAYVTVTVPATTYAGVDAVTALAVPSVLAARSDLGADLAYDVTDLVIEYAPTMAAERPVAEQLNVRTGAATAPVPLHPGAVRWYREHKP